MEIITNKIGVIIWISKGRKFKPLTSYISGLKTKIPPAGDGIPSKKFTLQFGSVPVLILKRASLKAIQTTYINEINHPTFPSEFKVQKYIIRDGATPKLIISVNESSSFPTLEVPLISLAILPSNQSIIAAKKIAIIDNL